MLVQRFAVRAVAGAKKILRFLKDLEFWAVPAFEARHDYGPSNSKPKVTAMFRRNKKATPRRSTRRRLSLEQVEGRRLMAADTGIDAVELEQVVDTDQSVVCSAVTGVILGADGNDVLSVKSNNIVLGQDGNDLLGNRGNDVLWGDRSTDRVEGQDRSDLLIVNNGDGSDFSVSPNGQRVRFQRDNEGLFTLDIGTTENLDVNGQGGNDLIEGGLGRDTLANNRGSAILNDGGTLTHTGDAEIVDMIFASQQKFTGGVFVSGGDIVVASNENHTIIAHDGTDFVSGGEGNDVILGADGNDV